MTASALTHPLPPTHSATAARDQLQIALAIADESTLKSLLIRCTPPITQPHRVGSVSSQVGVPVDSRQAIDGILSFEDITCVLASSPEEISRHIAANIDPKKLDREYAKLTRCESELHTLGNNLTLAQAIARLSHAGFSPKQVDEIINLPNEAWHKSWWYALDEVGHFTVPFLRLIRPLRYPDGTYTLQYRDHFAQDKPPSFSTQGQKVLVEIKTPAQTFRRTIERINLFRHQMGIQKALIIGDRLTELEARGFISQGISVYTTQQPVAIHAEADCTACANFDCPMYRRPDSPVVMCRSFCLDATAE